MYIQTWGNTLKELSSSYWFIDADKTNLQKGMFVYLYHITTWACDVSDLFSYVCYWQMYFAKCVQMLERGTAFCIEITMSKKFSDSLGGSDE